MSDLNFSLPLTRSEALPRTIAERTRRVYDLLATVYPLSTYFFHSKAHAHAVELSGIQNGMRVLEIATGSGEMFQRLAGVNPDGVTIGLDLSPNMAAFTQRRSRKRAPGTRSACGAVDVRTLPFTAESFDAVMCCYLIELLSEDDIARTLREVRRVLRPGGRFTLVVIGQNRPYFNRMYKFGGGIFPAFWGRQVESTAVDMLRRAGMQVTGDRYVQQGYYPSRVLVCEHAAAAKAEAGA